MKQTLLINQKMKDSNNSNFFYVHTRWLTGQKLAEELQ